MSELREAYQLVLSITPEELSACWFRTVFSTTAMLTVEESRLLSNINFYKDTPENWKHAYNLLLNSRKKALGL